MRKSGKDQIFRGIHLRSRAFFGFDKIGKLKAGEKVVVSAAAGAVG
jgi:hypothetical protein